MTRHPAVAARLVEEGDEIRNSISVNSSGGFSLLELAVVVLIIGVLAAGVLTLARPLLAQTQLTATEANMDRVIDVISAYAQRNHRIPCPANPDEAGGVEPFGAEAGSGAGGDQIGDCDNPAGGERFEGIVPFRTLGMKAEEVRDGYGRFLTYALSPVFGRDTQQALGAHKRCRVDGTWVQEGDSRNLHKARFCCPDIGVAPSTDLIVKDEDGAPLWPLVRDASAASYDAADVAFSSAATFSLAADNTTVLAFAIVSHGMNGYGAFLSTGSRLSSGGAAVSTDENENLDGDNVFVSRDRSVLFDDVLMWRTQDQIYAETGAGSCAFP